MPRTPEPNVICDHCGFKVKASQTRMQWNRLRVCKRHWEPRQPQDFIPPVEGPSPIHNARPVQEAVYNTQTDRDIF